MKIPDIPSDVRETVRRGTVIPAHPLALEAGGKMDVRSMRALTRYYIDAGVGGIAVGVHTTQFEIRDKAVGLLEPVLRLAAETADAWGARRGRRVFKVAGVCGRTRQALAEARLAESLGYHACLLSLAAFRRDDPNTLIAHCRAVSAALPLIGFYLQPAVGGRTLPFDFWRRFADLDNVLAVKIAPFNRYQTLDVVRAVCEAGREREIALYTGNDDSIVADLVTPFRLGGPGPGVSIAGGLLGHWCVWTRRAVELLERIQALRAQEAPIPADLLALGAQITDANAALFDSAHRFAGCLPGLHAILLRQGLLQSAACLDPAAALSPGQAEAIERVCAAYPHLNDDAFVGAHLAEWRG